MKITDYQLIDHGIDACDYFPGCGVSFTRFDHVVTGCGDNLAEAFEDALEQIASSEELPDTTDLEARIKADEGWTEFPTSPSVWEQYPATKVCENCEGHGYIGGDGFSEDTTDCGACGGSGEVKTDYSDDLYYYVSIRYNLADIWRVEAWRNSGDESGLELFHSREFDDADSAHADLGRVTGLHCTVSAIVSKNGNDIVKWGDCVVR